MNSKLRGFRCMAADEEEAPTEGCPASSHSFMLCMRENQTCWRKRITVDPQFPWHLAYMLPAGLRAERPRQESLKRRPEVGFQEAGGQTQVSLLGKAEPRWTQVLPYTALT